MPCAPPGDGLMAHTLCEERDLNPANDLILMLVNIESDPEIVQLATQLVERQVGIYGSIALEDRYDTSLRAWRRRMT